MFIFRNYTIENLFPEGSSFSGYGDISFIPSDEKDLIWLFQVPINFDVKARIEEIQSFKDKLALIVRNLNEVNRLYVCSLIDTYETGISDNDTSIEDAVTDFNKFARDLADKNDKVYFIDITEYFSRFPSKEWINWRFYFISQMIVAPNVAQGFYQWFELRKRQIEGFRKKCLVLDLDNTLWGGVLGEDGIEGIKIGGDYPGNAFLYFQEALISLADSGIILTLCSKNNEEDVLEAWEKNPFIKLSKKYISAYRINWNNKADNIRELASELNIGLESMVFLDDNPTERELVKRELPMVEVPDFPKKPYELMGLYKFIVDNYFRTSNLTDEDRKKTEQYKANAQRAAASSNFSNLQDFIKSLNIKIDLMRADAFNIPRIAQMTQKTNQFNLTTRRYTEADIKGVTDEGHEVFCAGVSDRFGDNGITGAAIVKTEGDRAFIDSFLLSCRILGKGIENAILSSILNSLFEKGIKTVEALYLSTPKNKQVKDFYQKNGFSLISEDEDGNRKYLLNLTGPNAIGEEYTINKL